MPTPKKRINLSVEDSLYSELEELQRLRGAPSLPSIVIELTKETIELREDLSYLVMPVAVQNKEEYDLIFIDGMHLYDYTLLDFFYADLMLKVGGYMIFDDAHMPSVAKVISYVLTNRSYKLVENTGLSIRVSVMIKVKDDDRNWDYHASF